LLAIAAVIIIAAIIWFILWWNTYPVISVNYAARINELRRPANYDPNEDGAILWDEAAFKLEGAGRIRQLKPGEKPERYWDKNDVAVRGTWPADVNSDELANVKGWLKRNAKELALIKEAEAKSQFWPQMPESDAPLWNVPWRSGDVTAAAASGLIWQGKIQIADGQVEAGIEDIMAAGAIGKCFGRQPGFIDSIVKSSCARMSYNAVAEVLARTDLTDAQLAWTAGRLREVSDSISTPNDGKLTEDCLVQDMLQRFYSDDGRGDGRLLARCVYEDAASRYGASLPWQSRDQKAAGIGGALSSVWFSIRADGRKATLARSRKLGEMKAQLFETLPCTPQFAQLKQEYDKCRLGSTSLTAFAGAADVLAKQAARHHACVNHAEGLQTTIAILRYRAAKGRLPENLPSLVEAGYLKELALDRFSGQPFAYRVTDEGFTLYSVGENGKDDGGTRKSSLDDVFWPVERLSGGGQMRNGHVENKP